MKTKGRTAFGERLVAARERAEMTQINAAKVAGMSQGTLGELELSGYGSSYTAQLAALYEVSPSWLATGKGRMTDTTELTTHSGESQSHPSLDSVKFIELIQLFLDAPSEDQEAILQYARDLQRGRSGAGVIPAGDKE